MLRPPRCDVQRAFRAPELTCESHATEQCPIVVCSVFVRIKTPKNRIDLSHNSVLIRSGDVEGISGAHNAL